MIKFFRKIRQQLISEGKTQKYLLYAFGEIFLVVIGILIALSLNNWNQDRKEAKKEAFFLEKMLEDLEAQKAEIDEVAEKNSEIIYSAIDILSLLGEDFSVEMEQTEYEQVRRFFEHARKRTDIPPVTRENFGMRLGKLTRQRVIDLFQATHLELSSTGQYDLIKDPTLQKEIIYNYARNADFLKIQDFLKQSTINLIAILEKSYIPIVNSLHYNDVALNLKDREMLKIVIKNHIYHVARSMALFYYTAKERGNELSSKIKTYLKTIE